VEVLSYALPVVAAALWGCARRFRGTQGFIPALFAAVGTAAILAVPAAQSPDPLAPCAVVVAVALTGLGLADLMRRAGPPDREEDGEDEGGGGGRDPDGPVPPRGGGEPDPEWERFEQAFWAHIRSTHRELAGVTE